MNDQRRQVAIEAGARALYGDCQPPWDELPEAMRWADRKDAATAIDAALPHLAPALKAEALREAQKAWGGNWGKEGRDVMFNALGDDLTPQGRVGKWLENRADHIERGEL